MLKQKYELWELLQYNLFLFHLTPNPGLTEINLILLCLLPDFQFMLCEYNMNGLTEYDVFVVAKHLSKLNWTENITFWLRLHLPSMWHRATNH